MTDRQNTTGSWTYSFTQPYTISMNPLYEMGKVIGLAQELKRLEEIDTLVDNMLTYPDAERIMNIIRKQGGSDA